MNVAEFALDTATVTVSPGDRMFLKFVRSRNARSFLFASCREKSSVPPVTVVPAVSLLDTEFVAFISAKLGDPHSVAFRTSRRVPRLFGLDASIEIVTSSNTESMKFVLLA